MVAALIEFAIVIGFQIANSYKLVPVSTTFLLVLAWVSLRVRRVGWRSVGFVRPRHWARAIGIGTAAGIGMELLALFITEPLIAGLAGKDPDLTDFRPLVGSLELLLVVLVPMCVLAAFGEEMVYRGYLMNRVAGFGRGTERAWIASLFVASALFGAAHEGQGLAGMLQEGFSGLLLGLLYLGSGRTLTVPIVAHGMANTVAFLLIFLGRYPGV